MLELDKSIIKQALDLSPVATLIVDLKSTSKPVVYVNQAFEALSGYDSGELIGRPWKKLLKGRPASGSQPEPTVELVCHPRLGVADCMKLDMLPLYDRPGSARFWVGSEQQALVTDTEENDSEREALLSVLRDARLHLRRLDGRDSATGVLNKRAFSDLLERDWVLARREKRALAAVIFQLDGFEAYHDVFGRHSADACLRKVGHAITGALRRGGDLTARYADDQFVVLMGHSDLKYAARFGAQIAQRVRGLAIHHPRSINDRYVTVSYGIASFVPEAGQGSQSLLKQAEDNLENPELAKAAAS